MRFCQVAKCGVGLLGFESSPDLLFPTFVTRFSTALALKLADAAEMVELEVEPEAAETTIVYLRVITHVTCDCTPLTIEYDHSATPSTVINFFGRLGTTKCFVWIISTPTKEVRLLVQTSDNTIVKKYERDRLLQ